MSTELTTPKSAISLMADRLHISQQRLVETLKATVFKTCKTDEQFAALMIVANEYQLNPLTKEIYAFPGKGGDVVPIVSIDGWLRIINSHSQFDGMDEEFSPDGEWCKVTIYRKDRTRPIVHTEFLSECQRNTEPWKQHTRRMLKWKTIIQAGRIAFGFGGIYDEDEGREVAGMREATGRVVEPETPATNPFSKAVPSGTAEEVAQTEQAKPGLETKSVPSGEAASESFALDDSPGPFLAYYESHKTQESKPGAKPPWKLWRLSYDSSGKCLEAVTFSETHGELIESLQDGEEILIEIEETKKGDTIKTIQRA